MRGLTPYEATTPEDVILAREDEQQVEDLREQVRAAMRTVLDGRAMKIFTLHYVDGWQLKDISAALGISYYAVQFVVELGREQLRRLLTGAPRDKRKKLTLEQVAEIRRLHATGDWTYVALGERFGVSEAAVRKVVRGEHWKGCGEEEALASGLRVVP